MMKGRAGARRSRGVTLIELVVALALVSLVMAAAVNMLLQSAANEAAYREQNAAQQNARSAADVVTDDLRGAVKNSLPTPPGNPDQNSPLVFQIYDDAGTAKTVRYWRHTESHELYRQLGNGSPAVIARHLSGFGVSCVNSTVSITVTATLGSAPEQSSVTVCADVVPRNALS